MSKDELRIQIGDHVLSLGQAMSVRVAITNFHMEVASPEMKTALGAIADGYHARLSEVLKIILAQTR